MIFVNYTDFLKHKILHLQQYIELIYLYFNAGIKCSGISRKGDMWSDVLARIDHTISFNHFTGFYLMRAIRILLFSKLYFYKYKEM